ncbi:MAG: amidohydrolase family protein, partial [Defluviitaleaceae bacterium]|nr:amidohydrolase family protein [Defluviitaleaceae bacterium]
EVVYEDDVLKLAGREAFAGSVAAADALVRNMVEIAGVPLAEAVEMATSTPAKILGLDSRKGKLERGCDADVVIFGENIEIERVIAGGETIFKK